jgi:hypothetical protein
VAVELRSAYILGAELLRFHPSLVREHSNLSSFGAGLAFSRPRLNSPGSKFDSFPCLPGLFLYTELT